MADNFTDWLYETLKNSPLGQRADANWEARQQGAPPALPIPGVDWAGIDASRNLTPLPTYVEGGIVPPVGVQGSKVDRRSGWNEFHSLTDTPINQVAYRNGGITRLPSQPSGGPKKLPAADPQTAFIREVNPNTLGYGERIEENPAAQAAAEITIRGGNKLPRMPLARPFFPTMPADPNDDPLLAEALKIGHAYKPSAKVQAALNAPAPPGSPGAPSGRGGGGLLGMLLGALGGGSGGSGGGLASILSGGGPATGQQLASMQQAAQTAQDPALAAALAAGNKSYVPTNGDPTGVLGYGALMPTVAMNGNPIRNR